MAKSPEEMVESMIANMPEKTGKSLDQWLKIVSKSGLRKHGEIMKLLKDEHGMTHGFANAVALAATGGLSARTDDADLIGAQYAGTKSALKPLYDQLIKLVQGFGPDVELSPKKAYVSLRRTKQFGLIQPSTATRLDLGLILKGVEPKGRLEASGSFSAMVTHRVRLEKSADIDAEVKALLKRAYDAA